MTQRPLPMTPRDCNREVLTPALRLLPQRMDTPSARVMLIAIALQESALRHRVQLPLRPGMPPGPARGLWQFERGGGVVGVLGHRASSRLAADVCAARGVDRTNSTKVWEALANDDILAACFARLLLWTDPGPMPTTEQAGWAKYVGVWRPGKPHPERWPRNWLLAQEAVHA